MSLKNPSRLKFQFTMQHLQLFVVILVAFVAFLLRIVALNDRPFHNDEGVNYFFIQSMFRDGFYKYSHANYHGPSYFYLTALFHTLVDQGEYGHRMSAVISSLATVLTPLMLGNLVSFRSKIYAMVFIALSSSGLYYGRYAIHESFLLFVSLSFSVFLFRWLETRESKNLVYLGMFLGLLISTKETFIIYMFATSFSALLIYGPFKIFGQLYRHYQSFLIGLLFCIVIVVLLFSGFFRHPDGLREVFFGIQQWVGRGSSDTGHHKPFWDYLQRLEKAEPVVVFGYLVFAYFFVMTLCKSISEILRLKKVFGFSRVLSTTEMRFGFLILCTGTLNFFIYSYVPYKTPWLIINLSLPVLFGLGIVLGHLTQNLGDVSRVGGVIGFVMITYASTLYALSYNFRENVLGVLSYVVEPQGVYGQNNPYAYVHAFDKMVELGHDIDSYMEKNPSSRILIGTTSYWPLPFYLRRHDGKLGYVTSVKKPEEYADSYQILILDPGVRLKKEGWRFKYYLMSDNQNANVYFKKNS